jgi:PAS domain S-box-containing protein
MTGVDMDITDRKSREEELRRSELRIRRLIESNIVPIACATESHLTEANDAFLNLVGLTRQDFQEGRVDWVKITPAEHLAKDFAALEQLKARGSCTPFEKEYLLPDGSRVPILLGATVLSTQPLEWLCFVLDLSELKGVEAQLRKSQSDLEHKVQQRTEELAVTLAAVKSEMAIRTQTEKQLADLSAQLMRLQDEERRRIARDLHDSTGQILSALKMTLGALGKAAKEVPKASELLEDANSLADQAVKDIRTLSYILHPPLLDEAGFASAAQWYVEGFGKRSGIIISMEISPALQLSKNAELALFRVLQESLTNVLRHSGSKDAEIRLFRRGGEAVLSVRDNGKGIPPEALEEFVLTGTGMGVGLAGMKQRLRDLGGELKLESGSGGTAVLASVPLMRVAFETDRRKRSKVRQPEKSG